MQSTPRESSTASKATLSRIGLYSAKMSIHWSKKLEPGARDFAI
jgi:hypothetical protein